jgi:hypothetical protein
MHRYANQSSTSSTTTIGLQQKEAVNSQLMENNIDDCYDESISNDDYFEYDDNNYNNYNNYDNYDNDDDNCSSLMGNTSTAAESSNMNRGIPMAVMGGSESHPSFNTGLLRNNYNNSNNYNDNNNNNVAYDNNSYNDSRVGDHFSQRRSRGSRQIRSSNELALLIEYDTMFGM